MYTYEYPHPAVTTDCVVFGFDGKSLQILLIERGIEPYKGLWALPGGFMKIDESVEECAARELFEETGVKEVFLEQFHVFSSVGRDPRERVVTVAFLAMVRKSDYRLIAGDDAARASWFELDELPPLAFDHLEIIKRARNQLKVLLVTRPVIFNLLDEKFSMPELQRLYEVINETTYDRRNFAKKMSASGFFNEEGMSAEAFHNRKAKLFSFKGISTPQPEREESEIDTYHHITARISMLDHINLDKMPKEDDDSFSAFPKDIMDKLNP